MIAEVLLVLAGHSSSLFTPDHDLHPAFRPLLHPGEEQCLQVLGQIALRYRKIKKACATLSRSRSRYVCALCATLNQILKDDYESLVVDTEAKILQRDPELVGHGFFVPLAAVRATFAEWDAPLAALESLMTQLESEDQWLPGSLIDMLLARSRTGVHRISQIMSSLAVAVQRTWRGQLAAFLVHGSLSPVDPLASDNYELLEGSMPSCVSHQSRESVTYVGRAIATVKKKKWESQIPREQALQHASLLDTVLPEDQYRFDLIISQIRTNVSEWLWLNVLTRKDVEESVVSLANYFLLRNGEFSLALIRDIEHLKISRLTTRSGGTSMIKEQDLNLALLRASLGTTAQHDPSLLHLKFQMPSGPIRPLLPSLSDKVLSSSTATNPGEITSFDDLLLGTTLVLTYNVTWPLDLFLHPSDLQVYSALFNYLSSLRKTHTRIHTARRRWTGLGDGGTTEDLEARKQLLRCGWGVVRDMGWFLDSLSGYIMVDVVDVEFRRFRELLNKPQRARSESVGKASPRGGGIDTGTNADRTYLDFTTLRNLHTTYLERLVTGCLLSHPTLTAIIRPIFEVCERFVAQVERWGGDVLPALLFEGSLAAGGDKVGAMVQERLQVVSEINRSLHVLLDSFYEELSLSTSQQPFTSILMASTGNQTVFQRTFVRGKGTEWNGEVRRHVERLLLRLDLNGSFSRRRLGGEDLLG
ncbi:Spc98 family-domain-containing protein [Boletus edulis]|nr:Spc98 family-domain-containing protein [Boletus edulis]